MKLITHVSEVEAGSKLCGQRLCVVPLHRQSAAQRRPVQSKGSHNQDAARRYRPLGLSYVSGALSRIDQKMEDGAVMPDVHFGKVLAGEDVGNPPFDPVPDSWVYL